MISAHEREDSREDRKKCVIRNSTLDLSETCWLKFKIKNLKEILAKSTIATSRQEVLLERGISIDGIFEPHPGNDLCFMKIVNKCPLQVFL